MDAKKNVNEKWHKLIGVPPEAKALQPELLLSLTIQSPNSLSRPLSALHVEDRIAAEPLSSSQKSATPDHTIIQKESPVTAPGSATSIPIPSFKHGYIQLGPENSCSDTYILHLCAKQLLQPQLLVGQESNSVDESYRRFQVCFKLMGQSSKTNFFGDEKFNKSLLVNEEVTLPLRTSLRVLYHYLQENPCATISLLHCGKEIAASELYIRSIVPTNDVVSFSREFGGENILTQKCILVCANSGSVPIQDNLQPSLEVVTRLKLVSFTAPNKVLPVENKSKQDMIPHNAKPDSTKPESVVCGILVEEPASRSESRQSQDTFIVSKQSGPVWVPVTQPSTLQSQSSLVKQDLQKNMESYESIFVQTVEVVPYFVEFSQPFNMSWIKFVFDCPISSTIVTKDLPTINGEFSMSVDGVSANISVQSDICIQVYVFGKERDASYVHHFATAEVSLSPSKLSEKKGFCVTSELKAPFGEKKLGLLHVRLNLERLSRKNIEKYENIAAEMTPCVTSSPNKLPFSNNVVMKDINIKNPSFLTTKEPLVSSDRKETEFVDLLVNPQSSEGNPQHHGYQTASTKTDILASKNNDTPSAAPFDSTTAYKIVEELEDWKEKQQEIFLDELKEKEAQHIARLSNEWAIQVKTQNIEIENKMAECKAMVESLSKTKQDLRDRLKTCAIKEQELRKAKEELDLQYNVKFQDLTLAAKRLDEGVKLRVALAESKCQKLEERVKELESENRTLHERFSKKSNTLNCGEPTCGMTHKQVSQLLAQVDQLEGRLYASLESKAYFKEQWGRAVREMNQAKLQFKQTSDNNKCMERLLGKEEKELQNDQRTLEKLQQEIAQLHA